ncbi:putative DNA helicase [Pseudomonas phage tabernarius]|uniref:Putative DNA helicase n=1 Tax=Pseudomonas phage tabernarius TaxID=2048978 RepID=A0A2H4P6V8_9CAUD|nr:DNA helicase [Pseudomonas phage tabernarius]ATW57914.1 putative DNA helicase [Pseudomonas phage tabernarius]
MNDKESRFARRFKTASQRSLLIDFLETQRSGLSDSLMTNRRGCSFYVEFKSVDHKVRSLSCPLKGKFEKGQIAFLREKKSWGAPAFVLAEIGGEAYLLNPNFDLEEMSNQDMAASIESGFTTGPIVAKGVPAIITILSIVSVCK